MSTPSYILAHRVLPLHAGTRAAELWGALSGPDWSMWLAMIAQTLSMQVRKIGIEGAALGKAVIERDGIEMLAMYFPTPEAPGEPHFAILARRAGQVTPLRSFVFEMGIATPEEPVRCVMAEWTYKDVDNGMRVRFDATADASLEACLARVVGEMTDAAAAVAEAASAPTGKLDRSKLLPKLRHHRWMGWTELPGRPLLAMPMANLPHVAPGMDSKQRFVYVQHEDLDDTTTLAQLEAIAVANLAKRAEHWNVREKSKGFLGIGAKPVMLELVTEFAAERILDVAFLQKAHAELKASMLAVAIPVRGILWARAGIGPIEEIGGFVEMARRGFVDAPKGMEPMSPLVFSVMNGKITGTIAGSGVDPKAAIEPEIGFPWKVQPA